MTAQLIESMPRNRKTYRLDVRITEAMERVAKMGGYKNPSAWLEDHLFLTLKSTGYISSDEQPLGETRGGDRTASTNKNEQSEAE